MSKHNRNQERKRKAKDQRDYVSDRVAAKRAAKRAGGMVVLPPREGRA